MSANDPKPSMPRRGESFMSSHMPEKTRPEFLYVGESPEFDGVLLVSDPQTPQQQVFVLEPGCAVSLGEKLIKWGKKKLVAGKTPTVARPLSYKLDS